ncbi:MAG: ribosome silencing factor [Alphaproteobacteria bacterium]|nr:ribosome silencing factor [Alphaproteobacteria bacterium]
MKVPAKTPAARKAAAKPKAAAKRPAAKATKTKTPAKPKAAKTPTAKARAKKPAKTDAPSLLQTVLHQLDDAKAEAIVTIDLDGKGAIADSMVVASGRSSRHVGAIADQLVEKLKETGHRNLRIEGVPQCDWVLVDAGDVVVHLFRPEVRSFYNLEKLWSEHAPQERAAI